MWDFEKERIPILRELKGLAQQKMAEDLGVTKQQVSLWEKGTNVPSVSSLMRICNHYECPPKFFFAQSGEENNQEDKC